MSIGLNMHFHSIFDMKTAKNTTVTYIYQSEGHVSFYPQKFVDIFLSYTHWKTFENTGSTFNTKFLTFFMLNNFLLQCIFIDLLHVHCSKWSSGSFSLGTIYNVVSQQCVCKITITLCFFHYLFLFDNTMYTYKA